MMEGLKTLKSRKAGSSAAARITLLFKDHQDEYDSCYSLYFEYCNCK